MHKIKFLTKKRFKPQVSTAFSSGLIKIDAHQHNVAKSCKYLPLTFSTFLTLLSLLLISK
jgi:hypothetical protein